MPYSFRIVLGFLYVPKGYEHRRVVRRAYGSDRTSRECNHLQMSLQRQHFLLGYLKTLSVGPAGVSLTASRMAVRFSTN